MSLRFILGRAGSGKTYTCLQEIRNELMQAAEGSPLILLVPEQATFQMEKELAATPGIGGSIRAQVLSFRRLAYRILLEVGGATRPHIGDLGKRMMLRNIIERRKIDLKIFGRAAKQPGFADSLARVLSEFKMYGVDPGALEITLQHLHTTETISAGKQLVDKLEDLALLYRALEDDLSGRFTDPDDYLNLLAEDIGKALSIQNSCLWIDGFSNFTPQEYKVINKILLVAKRVNVALCMETDKLNLKAQPGELFHTTRETFDKLNKLAKEAVVLIEPHTCLNEEIPPRFVKAPAVAHIEKYFYNRPAPVYDGAAELTLIAAANQRVEIEGIAREITRLCRDHGYRWNEISVILRESVRYATYIQTIFTDHGIPFFIDQKQPVIHHPLIELVRSAFEVVESNWAYEPVFRFLKTDFALLSRDEVDMLENYVIAHGIRGKRWTDGSKWIFRRQYTLGEEGEMQKHEQDYLENINEIKAKTTLFLSDFYRTLKTEGSNVKLLCEALYVLLEQLDIPNKLKDWSEKAQAEGLLQKANEHAQVWDGFVGLLDEVVEALGETQLSISEFIQVINAGLESMRMGLIPPALDQVLVASLERSRNPNIRAAFVVGINDGMLPLRHSESGLINDDERFFLADVGLELAPDSKRKLLDEQFLVYIALTRASEKLYLSYSLADSEGGALMPSITISRIKELIPSLVETVLPVEPSLEDGEEYITHPERALTYLAAQLRIYKSSLTNGMQMPLKDVWWDIYNYTLQVEELKGRISTHISGLFHTNNEKLINKQLTRKLYGQTLKGSVSRLEKFAGCPFQHFVSYGLKLKERTQFKLAAPDLGQFFHAALKAVTDMVEEQKMDWSNLDYKSCTELTEKAVNDLAPQLQNEILLSTERLRYLTKKLKRTVERSVRTLAEHARRGQFKPVGLELPFGHGSKLPPLQIVLKDGTVFEMSGRIDRIDKAELEGQSYIRVIDFKSSASKLRLLDICFGNKLQLLTYMDVALENAKTLLGSEAKPAAILYFPMIDPLAKGDKALTEEKIEEEILKQMRTEGLVLRDKDVVALMDNDINKNSVIIPVGLKLDGEFYANSSVITEHQFDQLRKYVRLTLAELGERIATGEVEISPYQGKAYRVCQYCLYRAVCQFDSQLSDNKYRIMPNLDEAKLWEKILQTIDGGGVHE